MRRHVLHLVERKNIDMSGVFLFETLVAAPDTPNHIFSSALKLTRTNFAINNRNHDIIVKVFFYFQTKSVMNHDHIK